MSLKTAVALRHVHFEDVGAFAGPLKEAGYAVRYYDVGVDELWTGDPIETGLLIVLGGPVGAYESRRYPFLAAEIQLLEDRLAAGRPTLGICLGAQLMARALGASVHPTPTKEIGWAPVELTDAGRTSPLAPLGTGTPVLHWHGDTFDLPQGAVHLARTPVCEAQAFAVGRNALGLQFHPEVGRQGFERWLIGHAHEIAHSDGVDIENLRHGAVAYGDDAAAAGRQVLAEWLAQLSA